MSVILDYKTIHTQDKFHNEIMYKTEESCREEDLVYLFAPCASSL